MMLSPTGKGRTERPDLNSGLILTPLTLANYFHDFNTEEDATAIFADLANLRDGLREHADDSRQCIKQLCGITRREPERFFKLLCKIRVTLDSDDTSLAINTLDHLLNLRQLRPIAEPAPKRRDNRWRDITPDQHTRNYLMRQFSRQELSHKRFRLTPEYWFIWQHRLARDSRLLCVNRPARDGEMVLMNLDGKAILATVTLAPGAVEGFTVKQINKPDVVNLSWHYLYEIFAVVLKIEQEGGRA